ncbi:diguanylate cyclase [Vibrio sp. Of7-15]|uniref:GGDEF domain-containing response regulator n=1 Tax=Vibrio sp. Of7-15 TaxID=2724879 RepID=UPI001EF3CB4F|nr:diguanylate cyclase [Vibrio sp. Of7-15]MCG7495573.1 diguanylate cyclase [Vibrio sp. Of7-15]
MATMRIMLVDDIQMERMQLAIRLKQLGHEVKAVGSGQEAILEYANFDPDLVLLDVNMPEMNGFEVAERLREIYEEWVPIIFLSGHEEPEMIAKAIDKGGDDYIIKPVDKMVLSAKLKAMQRIAQMRHQLKAATAELEIANAALQKQVHEDGLTKVSNRRYLDQKLAALISWHGRHTMPLTIIMLDVDHFKAFNDFYGHIDGDHCLQQIAHTLKDTFGRSGEVVGRYGGEEFVVLISHCDKTQAVEQCRRLKSVIDKLNISHIRSMTSDRVTVSQGVLSWVPTGLESVENIYKMVDKVLYQAKEQGRDRFVAAEFI